MKVYVETNFILELAFVQEQHECCERLVALCEGGRANLVLPAFCIAESYETLIRRANKRRNMKNDLASELGQLGRSKPYKDEIDAFENITGLLVRSIEEENRRLTGALERILAIASVIPLEADVILNAAVYRTATKLSPQDSIVYSSVLHHLALVGDGESCFINRDRKGFDDPDVVENLEGRGCKMLFSFVDGCNYVAHFVNAKPAD